MKYKVLKECISPFGAYLDIGAKVTGEFPNSYIDRGFIEPLKEDTRWRAEYDDGYYYVNKIGTTDYYDDSGHWIDRKLYDTGNHFKSEATAQHVANAQKLMYEFLHMPSGNSALKVFMTMTEAITEARTAVLADDRSNDD